MKDKLEKNGHKKLYYAFKSFLTVCLFAIAVTALAAIPVGITYKMAETHAKEAEAESAQTSAQSTGATSSQNPIVSQLVY
jgi:hypothetical protein